MNPPLEDDHIDWSPQRRISLPPGNTDTYIVVSVRDFQRLRKRLSHDRSPAADNLPAAYFALFGGAVAVAVALPPLMASKGQPSWIVPTFIVSAVAFVILGTILAVISRSLKARRQEIAAEVAEEMREIESIYLEALQPLEPDDSAIDEQGQPEPH